MCGLGRSPVWWRAAIRPARKAASSWTKPLTWPGSSPATPGPPRRPRPAPRLPEVWLSRPAAPADRGINLLGWARAAQARLRPGGRRWRHSPAHPHKTRSHHMPNADEHVPAANGGQQPPQPVKIAFVLYPGFTALDIIGPFEALAFVPGHDAVFVATEPRVVENGKGDHRRRRVGRHRHGPDPSRPPARPANRPGSPAGHRVRPAAPLRYRFTVEGASRDRGVRAVAADHPRSGRAGEQRLTQPTLATHARSTPADDEDVERPADLAERQVPTPDRPCHISRLERRIGVGETPLSACHVAVVESMQCMQ